MNVHSLLAWYILHDLMTLLFQKPLSLQHYASFDVVAAKDEPGLYGEAESFLDGEPERFARQNLRSSATGLRDLSDS